MARTENFRLSFLGAAETVTGSMHFLEYRDFGVLVDCGMYQGRRNDAKHRNRNLPKRARRADALLLTHAHIDHSGNIPTLVKNGFEGPVYCTSATADLCQAMLKDSARIQESDANWLNRKNRKTPGWEPIKPLYTEADAARALSRFEPYPYDEVFEIAPNVQARFIDAGHVLGSASILVDLKKNGHRRRIAFSGDIGRRNLPILRDPVPPQNPDYVVMESTYGNRMHAPAKDMLEQLTTVIKRTMERGGKVIIPSFALERSQEIIYAINQLICEHRLPEIPIFLDSPLAINLTEVFRRHPDCYDAETIEFDEEYGDPFGFGRVRMTESAEESKQLNALRESAIIISASGMCEAGRIVHHLRNNIEDPKNTIVIVGYQAQHTLGRRIVERRPQIRIFGVERDLLADVAVLNAFSAHADRDELLWWAESCGKQVRRFFMVHGDPDQCQALAGHVAQLGFKTHVPKMNEQVELDR